MKIWEKELFGKKLRIEYGKMAKQSLGSILLIYGESSLLVTANASEEEKPGIDFFPLTVEFKEKFYAVGKIPGGFIKRESRPSEEAILSSRLIDRPIRPLFPKSFHNEVQVINTVFSMRNEDYIDTWGITGSSIALNLSPIPFKGIVAGVRVGYVNGEYIAFPTEEQMKNSKIDIVVAGTKDAVTMVEGEALEASEEEMVKALTFSHNAIKEIIEFQEEIISEVSIEKWEVKEPEIPEEMINAFMNTVNNDMIKECMLKEGKKNKDKAIKEYKKELFSNFIENNESWDEEYINENMSFIKEAFEERFKKVMRRMIIEENKRADGRTVDQIRPITCEVGLIPRVHGSSLFTRGETQSLGIITLGMQSDVQHVDTIFSNEEKKFMLHYNFPPFCTGEVKPLRGPARREIGHGHLAERSHKNLIPSEEEFPYTIRSVSEVLESNGSSSMATVCSTSLALMDAGVPIKKHVAGAAMGLIFEEDGYVVLTDILGMEDHLGDMDFKVTGTRDGITAFQMDVKVEKVNEEIMTVALDKAKKAREHILNLMYDTISEPRKELSQYVPYVKITKVPVDKIGEIIGPGGRVVKDINKKFEVETDINDEGLVKVVGFDREKVKAAINYVDGIIKVVKTGEHYEGTIKKIEKFGLFVEVLPGKTGLLHVSNYNKNVKYNIGDKIKVEVLRVEGANKFQLKEEGFVKKPYKKPEEKKDEKDGGN
ncbi:polyribonucleotide nucleotidyltransferase [Tepiditoga spiralis]|uniref:Polyribonucleotide nucleotidyltransferase n=1 Tax=Tepiditoga spiralis TaxID=2108365 RepID=A0A7G1GCB4_9BACT|nr:polyribonucleotide nucleotidyltransferase [Tepiditoga spiralis]BBE32079.1 polyribonucleotide nucleotidyltransferase [Tepiditoga spiralis]